jgi:hypothetical protein
MESSRGEERRKPAGRRSPRQRWIRPVTANGEEQLSTGPVSHAGGRWFDPSCAHFSTNACKSSGTSHAISSTLSPRLPRAEGLEQNGAGAKEGAARKVGTGALRGFSSSDHIRLNAGVLHLPKGEAHVDLALCIPLIPGARQIHLEFVRTALLGHAAAALKARAELPKQRGVTDVDEQGPHVRLKMCPRSIPPNPVEPITSPGAACAKD